MKNFNLFNQSFGTVGSPNQTGETLTRENRVGLMSYLRRTLMLLFAVLVMSVANIGMAWGTDVFSAVPIAGSNLSAKNLTTFTAFTSSQATISGGTLSYKQEDSSDKGIINTSIGPTGDKRKCFRIETNKCVYKMVLSGALQNGDVIAADLYNNNVELWFSTSESRPGSAPSTKLASGGTSSQWNAKSYTVTTGDGICGQTTIYIHRNSNTTHFSYLTITRAAVATTWYVKGDWNSWGTTDNLTGSGTELSATVNITTAGLYEFKIWNNSGGDGTWYGNGGNIGCNVSGWTFDTSSGNCKFFASETGNYTFTFNTSTKKLSVTYPTAQGKYYYKNTNSWGTVAVYRFKGGINNGGTGTIVTETETVCGDTYYFTYADPGTTLIFNCNSWDSQTGNLSASGNAGKYASGTGSSWSNFPTYTVTYNANGDGAGNATGTTGSVPTDSNSPYACGSTVTVLGKNTLAKSGYTFTGWNTAPGGGGTSYAEDATFTISANTTLYAQWEQDKYTVTYNVNGGGSVTPTSATQATGGASLILPTPTWSGYTFEGWYSAGTKIGNAGASYTPTANITLYAHWTDNISGKVFSFIDNNYGDKFKAFDLSGWVTGDANNKDKTHTNATTGVSYVIDDATWENKSMAVAALAKFKGGTTKMSVVIPTGKIATVKISYGAYGTGASDYSLTVNGTSQTNPSTKLTNDMNNAQVIASMKEITLNSQTGTLTLGISNTSKSLYVGRVSAVITGYTVSYAAGTYGSGSLASGTKTHGSNFTLSSSDDSFTRDGYVYDGWSTNADGSTKDYNLGGSYTTDAPITLYPHWVSDCVAPTTVNVTATVNEVSGFWFYPDDDVVLTAAPTGSPAGSPVTYQWKKNGADIDGATSSTYTIDDAAASDAGKYTCTISYGACSTTSAEFELKCMQFYLKNSGGSDISNHALTKVDATHATLSLSLTGGTTYNFRVTDGCNNWYGNSDATGITSSNCSNWTMPHDADCKVTTSSKSATYTFNFDFSAGLLGSEMKVSVVYPAGDQAAGKVIYWDNSVLNWASAPWYRIGKGTHNNKTQMTLVPGTANLYKVTTDEYNGFEYWHIANNQGQGTGNIFWTKDNSEGSPNAITNAMGFEGSPVTAAAVTFTPTLSHATGTGSDNDNCEFYEYGQQNGMKRDRVTITAPVNGTVTVNYTSEEDVASSFSATTVDVNQDLAHTVKLTSITAVANTGYDAGAITINGGDYSANYVVTGATTIAASFTPQTYSITYQDQGGSEFSGSHADGYPTTHTYGTATTLKTASKTGYTFGGWYGNSACTGEAMTSIGATSITAGIILYAKWTPAASLTAISADVLYQAASMANITFTDADQNFTGLSTNNLFKVYGDATGETKTAAKGKTITSTNVTDDIGTKSFTSHAFIEGSDVTSGTADPTYGAIEFITPSTAGILYVYITDGSSSNLKLRKKGTSTFTALTGASNYKAIEVDANSNYYIHGNASKRGLYGIQYVSTYGVSFTGCSNVTPSGDANAIKGKDYTATFTANTGYALPDDATVTIGGVEQTKGTGYTWTVSSGTGTLTVPAAKVTGAIAIGVTGDEAVAPTLYTVTFNSNDGSAVSPITQASEGASITMPAAPTYASHTFQGWVIGGTTYAAGDPYTPTANITAYASWKENCAGGGGGGSAITWDFTDLEAVAFTSNKSYSFTADDGETVMRYSAGSSDAIVAKELNKDETLKKAGYLKENGNTGSATVTDIDGKTNVGKTRLIRLFLTGTGTLNINCNGDNTGTYKVYNGSASGTLLRTFKADTACTRLTVTTSPLWIETTSKGYINTIVWTPASGRTCFYVTYNGNGAEAGSISDATAYAASDEVTVSSNTGASAFTKSGYHVGSWNTAANGSGTTYALGATFNISADVTLYAQWVADACSAPSAPTISGTSVRTVGQTITLNAACASGADASTTYTWYKGVDWATASLTTPVQAALTAGEGGRIFNKASCVVGDAGTYWCEASNGDGCKAHNATGFSVTVNDAAGDEHIYYYKDANHYSDGVYSDPEGNTASSGDNKSLSSPWMICNGCKAGVDSVVAHGATYDGKGNHMNAYIKLPTGGDATTKNIKFALSAGYTGTLTIKIGGYENNPTVTLQPLNTSTGVLGDAITPTSGTVGGVATTEDNFNAIEWPLATAGGTYVLTVTSKTGYISQIDMTTSTSATFNVTYNGNGNTGGTVPTDATNYTPGATVTVAANTGDGKLVKTNYTGAGWNTANNGTGTNYVPGSGTFTITANTTLYAHWTQLITLAPGTQGTGTNNAAVSWNGSVLRGFAAHTASGYALQGYYTEPTGGTKVLNADGSFAATNIDGFVTSGKWSNTGAAPTLYAQWEASSLLKWNLKVNVSESPITTLSKESAAPTVISVANMSNLDSTGVTIEASKRSALTSKMSTPAEYDADQYVSVQFEVASGYKLIPSDIKVKVQPVSSAKYAKLVLSDESSHEISYTTASKISGGSTQTVTMTNDEEVEFTGTVTLKIYCYGAADKYRLGTPIEINGSVEEACTPPTFSGISYSATEYTVGASASAISVTGAANVDSYQWKYNTVNDRTSGTNCGTGVSVTPSTESTGTLYYWCEMTNGCTTVKTAAVGIMVRNATTDPTVTWSDVKLNDATATPNYGGGNYVLRATVNETSWPGTLAASMITAPAGITIHHVTTGKADNKNYIEFKFDVTTAFDRASNATIDFNLALPEAGSYSALNSVKSVTYNDCSGGAAGQVAIKMGATASTSKSNPQNYWETAGAGRLMFNYGSNMGSSYNSSGYRTADSTFYYYAASTGQKWMFQTYIGGVNKVRVVFRAAGTIKSSKATITNFYYNTEYFASPGSNAVSFGEVSASKAGYSSGEDGYIEFTVPEMAANSYGAFVTGDGNMKVYGVVLYSENAGDGGSVATNPAWSDSKADGFTVEKNQSDANFGYTISTTTNTLGAISYSSSKPSVAAVDPVTGEVTITATGASAQSATITATLARSGCYQGATRTYTINVAGYSCTEPSGSVELTSGSATKCESESVTLTMTGFTEGADIQWYNGDSPISSGDDYEIETTTTRSTLTTAAAGTYSAIATKSCAAKRTNSITIANMDMSEQKTVRKVSQWYVKNGRLTPDIALWQLGEGETFKSVAWSPTNGTGLDFVTRNGIVYLEGKEPSTNTSADIPYTLTLTITDACGTDHVLSGQTITLTHQKNTDKHVLAFVVNGTAKGGFTEGITAAQTTSVGLYNAIAAQFDVQATNIYSTDDEQKLREYYSQYDILCITDYPNTQTKGANSKSYVDAIGALIDIRPILTMEAFVSSLSNWKLKGVSGNPKSPSTRQYTMLLQCKDHEIFNGVTTTKMGEGDEAMYRVTIVDKNQEEYKTLDANYGDGEHKSNEGYQYGKKPALQGFTYTEEMSENDLLPLGLIDDGAGNDLQVGIERQTEMEARLMVLGINSYAMERLTDDGKTIVINALKYLMKKNAEDISDCSVYFDGSDESDPTNWDNELNWGPSYASLPLYNQEVRILKPCVVKDGVVARASGIKIIPRGRINHDTDDASGSLTIEPGGALIVDGKVRAAVAPNYFNATPTTPSNLVLQSNSSAQAALILDNSEGETQATVTVRSKANKEGSTRNWQYLTSPLQETPVTEFFYGVGTYTYKHSEADGGWVRYNLGTAFNAFDAIGLTQEDAKDFVFYGPLAPTGEWNLSLTHAHSGNNLFGNSWTAPIDLKALVRNTDIDDSKIELDLAIYNTGSDRKDGSGEFDQLDNADDRPGTWHHIPLLLATLEDAGWEGMTVIPAYQAFQLKATAAATLTIDYDKCVRGSESKNYTEPLRSPGHRAAGKSNSDIEALRLAVSDAKGIAYIYLLEGEQFTEGYDNGWELEYKPNSKYGKLYAISPEQGDMMALARPSLEGTMVGFQPGESSEYTITFNETDGYYYLNDLKMEQSTLIQAGESYTFSVEEGESANRFLISSVPFNKPGIVTGVTNPNAEVPKAQKVIYNDKLYIIRGGKVFSADGQLVK